MTRFRPGVISVVILLSGKRDVSIQAADQDANPSDDQRRYRYGVSSVLVHGPPIPIAIHDTEDRDDCGLDINVWWT